MEIIRWILSLHYVIAWAIESNEWCYKKNISAIIVVDLKFFFFKEKFSFLHLIIIQKLNLMMNKEFYKRLQTFNINKKDEKAPRIEHVAGT